MTWKSGKSDAPEQCPEGARVLAYIAGSGRVVRGEYQGNVSARFKLGFEVEPGGEGVQRPDGSRFTITKWFGASVQEKSHVGVLIATGRGAPLRETEMGTMDAAPDPGVEEQLPSEVEQLLTGLRVLVMVKHGKNGWADFHVDSAVAAPQQAKDEGW